MTERQKRIKRLRRALCKVYSPSIVLDEHLAGILRMLGDPVAAQLVDAERLKKKMNRKRSERKRLAPSPERVKRVNRAAEIEEGAAA